MSRSDWTLRWLSSFGGFPGIIAVALGVLLLLGVAVGGVWTVDKISAGLDHSIDLTDAVVAFALLCVFFSVFLLVAPVCAYVKVGQKRRLDIIKGYYSPEMIAVYFDQFWAGRDGLIDLIAAWRNRQKLSPDALKNQSAQVVQQANAARDELNQSLKQRFNDLLMEDFGFSIYLIPLILLTAVAIIVLYFGFLGGISLAKALADSNTAIKTGLLGIKLDLVSVAAIFGAFTWVASDSITRNYQGTFHPSDLLWYALRLVIAIPLGETLSMLATDPTKSGAVTPGWGAFLAFVISMFSFDNIMKYLSVAANKVTNVQPGGVAERDDLVVRLPGVDDEAARRFGAEGVTTISQLVSVDPVRLAIRSGLQFDFVLAQVDAAILWTYVGNKIAIIREFGFKGASNVLLFAQLNRESTQTLMLAYCKAEAQRQTAEAAKDAAAQALDAAQEAMDLDPKLATLQQQLTLIEAQLANSATPDALKTTLTQQKDDLTPQLEQMRLPLMAAVEAAEHASADAETANNGAAQAAVTASAALTQALKAETLLKDMAGKAAITESGFDNIVSQLTRDDYAQFIRRLMVAPT